MSKVIYEIEVVSDRDFTEEELIQIKHEFKFRIEGYHTEGLPFLEGADISIKGKIQSNE